MEEATLKIRRREERGSVGAAAGGHLEQDCPII